MSNCDAYVLMRIFNNYSPSNGFKEKVTSSICSVHNNATTYSGGNLYLVVFDDSPNGDSYPDHKECFVNLCSSLGFSEEVGNLYYYRSDNTCNSAYATYCVREKFLALTLDKKDAFAVSLDQDDTLFPYAIENIASKMTKKGIVLSPFSIIDDGGKDITYDGGESQRKLTKKISKNPIVNGEASHYKTTGQDNLADLPLASSLGWSKSYSRYALSNYQEALTHFLEKYRGGVLFYYGKHPAYEDFVDFYTLLRPDLTISATRYKTHTYYKHKDSITSNPNVDDFRLHRTANLLLLIDLCYNDISLMRDNFKLLLLRYITIKVADVERILAKYRAAFKKGDMRYFTFEEDTHDNYFINKLYRLAQGDNRHTKQDDYLFEDANPIRCENTKSNFDNLFSCDVFNSITAYKSKINNANSRFVIQKAFLIEKSIRPVNNKEENKDKKKEQKREAKESKKIWKKEEEDISRRYDKKRTPNQRRSIVLWALLGIWCTVIIGFILMILGVWPFCGVTINIESPLLAAIVAVLAAVLTFLLNELSKVLILAQEEIAKKKLYFSEFEDLIRHLEANLKVMIEIRKKLSDEIVPASIHFINLSWPNSSCLFSDDISKVIDKKKVDDFARLKVNLRNIQNSSVWLSTFMKEPHSTSEICNAIDWEIARHFGYLMNFHYLKNNHFQFPSQNELDYYINDKHLLQYLMELFISYTGYDGNGKITRMKLAKKYLNLYYDDRRMCRNVVFVSKPSNI